MRIVREQGICDILEHVKFAEFKDTEPPIEGLVDGYRHVQIESHKGIFEDGDTMTLRFAREFLTFCGVCQESDIGVLCLILSGLAGERLVLGFEERILHLGPGGGTEICILGDVWLEPA